MKWRVGEVENALCLYDGGTSSKGWEEVQMLANNDRNGTTGHDNKGKGQWDKTEEGY